MVNSSDGDSIRVWVKAYDVMQNTAVDSVLVHVDSSPPIVDGMWLNRYGNYQLAVHNHTDIFEMS